MFLFLCFSCTETRSPTCFAPLLFLWDCASYTIELFITSGSSNRTLRGRFRKVVVIGSRVDVGFEASAFIAIGVQGILPLEVCQCMNNRVSLQMRLTAFACAAFSAGVALGSK